MTDAPLTTDDLMAPHRAIDAWHSSAMANLSALNEAVAARAAARKAAESNIIRLANYRPPTLRSVLAAATIFPRDQT